MQIDATTRDLFILDALGGILLLVIFLIPTLKVMRAILGLPYVLFFPGYFLVSALFPGKDDLEGLERLALSLGLSLAIIPLIGLVLNYTPFGIRLWPVTIFLYVFMLAMTRVAQFRRKRLGPRERFTVDFSSHLSSLENLKLEDKVLAIGFFVAVIGAGIGGTFLTPSNQGDGFTEFYLLGPEGKMDNYHTHLTVGEVGSVTVGIQNHDHETENYRILMTLENNLIGENSIVLSQGDQWQENFHFEPTETGENKKLEFLLYLENNPEPYYKLRLWLTVGSGQ